MSDRKSPDVIRALADALEAAEEAKRETKSGTVSDLINEAMSKLADAVSVEVSEGYDHD